MPPPSAPGRPYRRRVLLNTAATGAGNVWTILLTLVAVPALLAGLGPEAFGLWALLQTFSAVSGWLSLGDLGLTTASTRFVAEKAAVDDDPAIDRLIGTSLLLYTGLALAGGVLLAVVGLLAFPTLFEVPGDLAAAFGVAIVATAAQTVADQVNRGVQSALEGLQRVDLSRGLEAARKTLTIVAAVVTAALTGDLGRVAVASLAGSVIALGLSVLVLQRHRSLWSLRFDREAASTLIAYGRTIAVLRPLGVIHRTMDRLLVGVLLGPSSVAIVEIAAQIQNGAMALMSASAYSVIPSASWIKGRGDRPKLRDLAMTGSRYTTLLTVPAALIPALLIGPLLSVWIGPEGAAAAVPAVLLLTYTCIGSPLQVGSELLVGVGRAGAVLRAAALAIVVNLAASLMLIGPLGLNGVFVATIISATVLFPVLGRAILAEIEVPLRPFMDEVVAPVLRPTLLLTIGVAGVLALGLNDLPTVVLGAAVGGLAYVIGVWRTALLPEEQDGLRRLLRRAVPGSSGVSRVATP